MNGHLIEISIIVHYDVPKGGESPAKEAIKQNVEAAVSRGLLRDVNANPIQSWSVDVIDHEES